MLGDVLYFTHGGKLWRTDGSTEGAHIVYSGIYGSVAVLDNAVFFAGYDAATGYELRRVNQTASGTSLVRDISPGTAAKKLDPALMHDFNGILYFIDGNRLLRSDGTAQGTSVVKEFPYSSSPAQLASFEGSLYIMLRNEKFALEPPDIGDGLWRSDGTETGTTLLNQARTRVLGEIDGALIFNDGSQIWRLDANGVAPALVADCGCTPLYLASTGSRVFIYALADDSPLWVSDGSRRRLGRSGRRSDVGHPTSKRR